MDSRARESLASHVVALCTADETEVLVYADDRALTRFTHESVNQNVEATNLSISIRAIVAGRTGVARTNRLDEDSLRAAAQRAVALARFAPSDPLQPPLPSGGATQSPHGAFDDATARADAQIRARMAGAIFERCEAAGFWGAGYVSTASAGTTIANTSGVMASFDATDAALNVKTNATDSTGFAERYANAIGAVDAAEAGAVAVEKARASAAPSGVEPGNWTVILEPAAFGEMLSYLSDHFSAQSFEDGASFFSGALDRSYFGENVSIFDDYAHPLAPSMPFDFEGTPKRRLALVQDGIVRNVVTDSYYAHKLDRPNTGHALPAPNAYGPQPLNIVVSPGSKTQAELVAETQRGLLVTRFWYIRTVDQKKAIVTGMTRDGTFLIENGRVTRGVRNLRFNYSVIDLLRDCELARDVHRTGGYDYSIVVPTIKSRGFAFTSSTEF